MHAIRTTRGFVIGSRPYGEADKIVSVFTRDLGLVSAVAQGIRREGSKLRYHVQDLSLGDVSLVRGRELWRLTSARMAGSPLWSASPEAREAAARIAAIVQRLVRGEAADPGLFDRVEAFAERAAVPSLSPEELRALESLSVLRILAALGYIGDEPDVSPFVDGDRLDPETLSLAAERRLAINKHINKALKESHL